MSEEIPLALQDGIVDEVPPPTRDYRDTPVPPDDSDEELESRDLPMIRPVKRLRMKTPVTDIPGKRGKYQQNPQGIGSMPMIAMHACLKGTQEWFTQEECDGIATLMDHCVFAARVHRQPRRRLYDHGRCKNFNRLTIMLTEGQNSAEDDLPDGEGR